MGERYTSQGGREARANESGGVTFSTARGQSLPETDPGSDGYAFLLDSGVSTADLVKGLAMARAQSVPLSEALLAGGLISEEAYARAIAAALDLQHPASFELAREPPLRVAGSHPIRRLTSNGPIPTYAIAATIGPLKLIRHYATALTAQGFAAVIVTPRALGVAIERADRTPAVRRAIASLRRTRPAYSASRPFAPWQILMLVTIAGLATGGALIAPGATIVAILAMLAVPFVGVAIVRAIALAAMFRPIAKGGHARVDDAELPTYTVLVPLFNEAEVVPALVESLSKLDYPKAKLDIALVLEEVDVTTKLPLLTAALPPFMRIIVVPDAMPRTKPKALNYAMQFARGDFIVVFDAEDQPEIDQLRKAVAAFRNGPTNLACVQARLNIYNVRDSWFTRQFAIEYSALFDAILPALDWLRLPVPLGGTSNHFPRALLDAVGGWDPFNVTEDADLGVRLARLGYVTQILDSTTWEEAPVSWSQWKPQRTRWLKGWYQTYLVHTRNPGRLTADLGLWRTFGFHLFLGGIILSTLMHPIFYLILAWTLIAGESFALPDVFSDFWLWLVTTGSLVIGYLSAMLVGAIAAHRRGHGLVFSALQMPFCWLLVSYAAYRAAWQLIRDPFLWEKTAHGRALRRDKR